MYSYRIGRYLCLYKNHNTTTNVKISGRKCIKKEIWFLQETSERKGENRLQLSYRPHKLI